MTAPPDLRTLTEVEKDALIRALWAQVQTLTTRVAELEARLNQPPKTPGNSSLPPSRGHKANRPERAKRPGPRQGSLGRAGGGRPLAEEPDQLVIAKAATCAHCRAALAEADQRLHARYDKVELPPVRPVVTRVERYLGRCPCCGGTTLAPVPEGMEQGSPFGVSVLALALYLRFTHAISYRRLTQLLLHLFALPISEGALDGLFRHAKPRFDDEAAAILARLRRARVVCSQNLWRRATNGLTPGRCETDRRNSLMGNARMPVPATALDHESTIGRGRGTECTLLAGGCAGGGRAAAMPAEARPVRGGAARSSGPLAAA